MWQAEFHRKMLAIVKDEHLAVSDFGIDTTWCGLLADAFPKRPTCLVLPSETAIHINTHTIEKFMTKHVATQERSCTGTCKTLYSTYKRFWKNFSHHNGDCWGTHQNHLGLVRTGRFSLEGMTVRARAPHGALPNPSSNSSSDSIAARRWIGATSLPYPAGRAARAHFDGMMLALTTLMNAQHKLRIVVNHDDR